MSSRVWRGMSPGPNEGNIVHQVVLTLRSLYSVQGIDPSIFRADCQTRNGRLALTSYATRWINTRSVA
jgi:hypothetical protein